MTLNLHSLQPASGARTKKFRIGRGLGSGRGKTAGRGTKGQRSRTGGRKRLALKGMKQLLLSFPKNRGFQSRRPEVATVPVGRLNVLPEGALVNVAALRQAGLIRAHHTRAKLVAGRELLQKRLRIRGIAMTAGARLQVEAAAGKSSKKTP